MVIRTEYRGQRYSMGSSDPLSAEFEIRFGSLNFQATGTATSCASPTAKNFVRDGRPGQPRPLSHLPLGDQCPLARMLQAPQRLDAVDAPDSALDRRGRNTDRLRAPHRHAAHSPARRQPPQRGSARFQDHGSPSACAAPRRRTSPPLAPTQRRAGHPLSATPRRPGTLAPPPTTSHPPAPLTSSRPPPHTGTRNGTSPACRAR
jgi:hypothetical protein